MPPEQSFSMLRHYDKPSDRTAVSGGLVPPAICALQVASDKKYQPDVALSVYGCLAHNDTRRHVGVPPYTATWRDINSTPMRSYFLFFLGADSSASSKSKAYERSLTISLLRFHPDRVTALSSRS